MVLDVDETFGGDHALFEGFSRGQAFALARIGSARMIKIAFAKFGGACPISPIDELSNARAVSAVRRTKDAKNLAPLAPQRILALRLVQSGDALDGCVKQPELRGKHIPQQTGNPQRDV